MNADLHAVLRTASLCAIAVAVILAYLNGWG
jgi:hypothetical protein